MEETVVNFLSEAQKNSEREIRRGLLDGFTKITFLSYGPVLNRR